jgi:HPt (histidine-containing phosphotransfer) domain-containing protein
MTRDTSMSPKVRLALDKMWPGVYEAARAHFALIDDFLRAGDDGTPAQHLAARSAAHRLNGSLGMFGRRDASCVAASIEALLANDCSMTRGELRTLVDQLDGLLGTTTQ